MAKNYTIGKNNKFPLSKRGIVKNLFDSEFLQFNSWLFQAEYRDAKVEMFDDGYSPFIWRDGTWESGTWKGGIWYGGTWEDGIWKNGNWYNGTWKDGTWEDGNWYDGTWESGTWIKGKILDGKDWVASNVSPAEYFSGR